MKKEKCKKCNRGYKRLTHGGLCFFCDPEKWAKDYKPTNNKK